MMFRNEELERTVQDLRKHCKKLNGGVALDISNDNSYDDQDRSFNSYAAQQ